MKMKTRKKKRNAPCSSTDIEETLGKFADALGKSDATHLEFVWELKVPTTGNSEVGNCGDFELESSATTGVYID